MTPIHIVATTVAGTGEAIATAADLARGRHARVHVIAARPMPLESSLDQQAGAADAFAREIRRLTEASPAAIDVLPCVCRRLMDVTQLLPHGAFVIVAGQSHRWWPTREQRLAHDLHALGYRVLFIHIPDETAASSDE